MKTRATVITDLLIAGVENLDELKAQAKIQLGQEVSTRLVSDYRSKFRRFGPTWQDKIYNANAETHRIASRRWKQANTARRLLHQCKASAKYRGHECLITEELLARLLQNMTCSATGLPLTLEWKGPSGTNPWAPSVDRLDNSLGYVPGNVRIVCWAFNNMRGDFPDEVIETLVRAYSTRIG